MNQNNFIILSMLGLLLGLVACSSGDSTGDTIPTYTGLTSAAEITSSNAEELGVATIEALESAINQDAANRANPYAPTAITTETYTSNSTVTPDLAINLYNQLKSLGNLPLGLVIPYTDLNKIDPNYCGGSVSVPDSMLSSTTFNGTIQLTNLCYNDPATGQQVTLNGTITFTETVTEVSFVSNMSIAYNGITQTANIGISCSLDADGFITYCNIFSNYVGSDQQVYRIADVTFAETLGSYHLEATFYHPDYGQMQVLTNPDVTFGCPDGKPDSGTINLDSTSGTSATITFRNDCTGYDGTYNDGTVSGTFSANWL